MRICPADREHLRVWLGQFKRRRRVEFAMEGCTGWRYVAEEVARIGGVAHVAEPADVAALRGKKRQGQDRSDRHRPSVGTAGVGPAARELDPARGGPRGQGESPDYLKDLSEEQTVGSSGPMPACSIWASRPSPGGIISTVAGHQAVEAAELSPAVRHAVRTGLEVIDTRSHPAGRAAIRARRHGPPPAGVRRVSSRACSVSAR